MDKIEMRFGQRVKELRLKQNISQEELAFRCQLSKNYISDSSGILGHHVLCMVDIL